MAELVGYQLAVLKVSSSNLGMGRKMIVLFSCHFRAK
jgi:hypothetical protein